VGKLLLATQIYDMHRIAHEVSGGLIVALPGPDEDHNPATSGDLATLMAGRADIPYEQRAQVARFMGDISSSSTGGWYSVISLHGGGSPQAMKREIFRRYPIEERRALVERLLDRGVAETGSSGAPSRQKQPGQCCATGCQPPAEPDSSEDA
jgi:4-hydroxybutyryl-CoA dehydratase/vinylacetyl-CoA-Delta-isomerase